jgi:hypothetical protein
MRAIIGFIGTGVWIAFAAAYVVVFVGVENVLYFTPNEIGDLLTGFFTPLAFFWIIVGYFQQSVELRKYNDVLRQQSEELKRATERAELQARTVSVNELYVRRDVFLRVAELTSAELESIARDLVNRVLPSEDREKIRESYKNGDKDVYFMCALNCFVQDKYVTTIDILKQHSDWLHIISRYCRKFERLLKQAEDCDPDGHLREHFQDSAIGRLYATLRYTLISVEHDGAPSGNASKEE